MVVIVSCCDRSFFAMAKNGVGVIGVSSASSSFSSAGLLQMVTFKGSFSVSELLADVLVVCLGSSTS